jgi:hypothetical protein
MNKTKFFQNTPGFVQGTSFYPHPSALRGEQHFERNDSFVERSQSSPPKYSNDWLIAATREINPEAAECRAISELKHRSTAMFGWLRNLEIQIDPASAPQDFETDGAKRQHTTSEKAKALKLFAALKPYGSSVVKLVAHAWGVSTKTLAGWAKNPTKERKRRNDSGMNAITSESKQRSFVTPKRVFTKLISGEQANESNNSFMDNDKWDTADTTTKEKCAEKAELMLQQGPLTLKIIYKFFDQGRQNMSWAEIKKMTSGLGIFEMLGKYTIRNAIISLPDSSFTSDRSRPKLDSENKLERYCWAREFLMFWKSAVTFNEVQILLVHMDVMWFWSTVERRNHEWVPIFGMEPVNQPRSQATSLEKTSVLMSAAFAPVKNDLTKGGLAYLVSLEQLGARARAKQKIYSRVYHDSGSYTYPEVAENVLVERGKRYVKDVGLEEFNFKSFFRNDEFDSVEEIAIRVGSKTGKRVKVRYQMHNSHIDEDLRIFLEKEFEKRDWQLTYPPPDSSICNVIDDCIAPALVNEVKRELVLTNKNNKVLARHELWPVVNKCWHYCRWQLLLERTCGTNTSPVPLCLGAAETSLYEISVAIFETALSQFVTNWVELSA